MCSALAGAVGAAPGLVRPRGGSRLGSQEGGGSCQATRAWFRSHCFQKRGRNRGRSRMSANKQETSCGLDSAGAERELLGRPAPAKPRDPPAWGKSGKKRSEGSAWPQKPRAGLGRRFPPAHAAARPGPSADRARLPPPRAFHPRLPHARFTRGCRPKVPREVFRRAAGRPGLRLGVQWRLNRDRPGGCFPGVFSPGAPPWKGALVGALAALLAVLAALALGFLRRRRRCQGTGAGPPAQRAVLGAVGLGGASGPRPRATGAPPPRTRRGNGAWKEPGTHTQPHPSRFPFRKAEEGGGEERR